MDLSLHDLGLKEIIKQLTECSNAGDGGPTDGKVRIVSPEGHRSCVGKIFAITTPTDGLTVFLCPVPEDIESINSVSRLMAMMTCDKAAAGQECGTCPDVGSCPQMEAIDESVKRTFAPQAEL